MTDAAMTLPDFLMCRPKTVEKIWGGDALHRLYNKGDGSRRLGESWEVADLPEGQSELGRGNRFAPLQDWVKRFGALLTGSSPQNLPLLLKIIHAEKDLSIQVHPGEADLVGLTNAQSKDECWLILHAKEDAFIWHGLNQKDVPKPVLRDAIERGDITSYLRRIPVTAGDVISIPPGTPHAICKNIALLEVQEPSDTTFRLWDYNRPGLDGRPRALHRDEGIEVLQTGEQPDAKIKPQDLKASGHQLLIQRSSFRMERLMFPSSKTSQKIVFPNEQFVVATCTKGKGQVGDAEHAEELKVGQSILVPASTLSLNFHAHENLELVFSGLGPSNLVSL